MIGISIYKCNTYIYLEVQEMRHIGNEEYEMNRNEMRNYLKEYVRGTDTDESFFIQYKDGSFVSFGHDEYDGEWFSIQNISYAQVIGQYAMCTFGKEVN